MKLFKNISIILALVLCFTALLSGCTDDKKENEKATVNSTQTQNDNESADLKENEAETDEAAEDKTADGEKESLDEEETEKDGEKTDKDSGKNDGEGDEKNALGFQSEALANAIAQCLGKKASQLTQDDILSIRYLAIGPEEDGSITAYVGLKDYADFYFSKDVTMEGLQKLVKTATMESSSLTSNDLEKFSQLEVFELYNCSIDDASFLNSCKQLVFGYFKNNGITDISALEGYNPALLRELDFTGNKIEDWTPVLPIKDKVIVDFSMKSMTDEQGNEVEVPFIITLADITDKTDENSGDSQQTTSEGNEQTEEKNAEGTADEVQKDEEKPPVLFEDADFSVLFE